MTVSPTATERRVSRPAAGRRADDAGAAAADFDVVPVAIGETVILLTLSLDPY